MRSFVAQVARTWHSSPQLEPTPRDSTPAGVLSAHVSILPNSPHLSADSVSKRIKREPKNGPQRNR